MVPAGFRRGPQRRAWPQDNFSLARRKERVPFRTKEQSVLQLENFPIFQFLRGLRYFRGLNMSGVVSGDKDKIGMLYENAHFSCILTSVAVAF